MKFVGIVQSGTNAHREEPFCMPFGAFKGVCLM